MPPPPNHKTTKKLSSNSQTHKFTEKPLTFSYSRTQLNNIAIAFPLPAATDNNTQHSLDACQDPNYNKKAKAALDEVEDYCLDPSPNSFSQALKECQNRRIKSESHSYIERTRSRPTSVDLNGAIISPRFLVENMSSMKKSPNLKYSTKGWSSERVAMPTHSSRRYPFGNRAIPSKWEDAEKWIFSPNSDNAGRLSVPPPHHRRPKSKSGPLGPPAYMMMMSSSVVGSPLNPGFDSGRVGGFGGGSPFLGGNFGMKNIEGGRCSGADEGGCRRSSSVKAEPYILRTSNAHGWSESMAESCSSQDEKLDSNRETSTMTSSSVLTKDVATQMSPDSSMQSSPKARHSLSKSQPSHPIEEVDHFSKLEVRDVQVDDRVTVTRWSKKHVARGSDRRPLNILEWRKKILEPRADSISEVAEIAKNISRSKREEAKITAWENLQKAKAEASIRKLEMKLEKKRATSMDKIMKNLRHAQKKAGEMRSAAATNQSHSVEKNNSRSLSYFSKAKKISALGSCFRCPAH